MSKYHEDAEITAYIDERMKEINESVYPILNGSDCTFEEYREGIKREKFLLREVKDADKDFFLTVY